MPQDIEHIRQPITDAALEQLERAFRMPRIDYKMSDREIIWRAGQASVLEKCQEIVQAYKAKYVSQE